MKTKATSAPLFQPQQQQRPLWWMMMLLLVASLIVAVCVRPSAAELTHSSKNSPERQHQEEREKVQQPPVSGTEPGKKCICPRIFAPVCAIDGQGMQRNVANECIAYCEGYKVKYPGICMPPELEQQRGKN